MNIIQKIACFLNASICFFVLFPHLSMSSATSKAVKLYASDAKEGLDCQCLCECPKNMTGYCQDNSAKRKAQKEMQRNALIGKGVGSFFTSVGALLLGPVPPLGGALMVAGIATTGGALIYELVESEKVPSLEMDLLKCFDKDITALKLMTKEIFNELNKNFVNLQNVLKNGFNETKQSFSNVQRELEDVSKKQKKFNLEMKNVIHAFKYGEKNLSIVAKKLKKFEFQFDNLTKIFSSFAEKLEKKYIFFRDIFQTRIKILRKKIISLQKKAADDLIAEFDERMIVVHVLTERFSEFVMDTESNRVEKMQKICRQHGYDPRLILNQIKDIDVQRIFKLKYSDNYKLLERMSVKLQAEVFSLGFLEVSCLAIESGKNNSKMHKKFAEEVDFLVQNLSQAVFQKLEDSRKKFFESELLEVFKSYFPIFCFSIQMMEVNYKHNEHSCIEANKNFYHHLQDTYLWANFEYIFVMPHHRNSINFQRAAYPLVSIDGQNTVKFKIAENSTLYMYWCPDGERKTNFSIANYTNLIKETMMSNYSIAPNCRHPDKLVTVIKKILEEKMFFNQKNKFWDGIIVFNDFFDVNGAEDLTYRFNSFTTTGKRYNERHTIISNKSNQSISVQSEWDLTIEKNYIELRCYRFPLDEFGVFHWRYLHQRVKICLPNISS